jgi:hypothetical protein
MTLLGTQTKFAVCTISLGEVPPRCFAGRWGDALGREYVKLANRRDYPRGGCGVPKRAERSDRFAPSHPKLAKGFERRKTMQSPVTIVKTWLEKDSVRGKIPAAEFMAFWKATDEEERKQFAATSAKMLGIEVEAAAQ